MKELSQTGVNQNLLNLIAPSGFEEKKAGVMIGENFAKVISITGYPTNPDYGWLSSIATMEGSSVSMEFVPTDSGALVARCNEQIKHLRGDLNAGKLEESVIQAKEKAIEDMREMIARINRDGEIVGYLNILIVIQAVTEEKLEERMKKVMAKISMTGCSYRLLLFSQKEAFLNASPYGVHSEEVRAVGERNMPFSTLIGGFPNAASGINDGTGYLLGKTMEREKPIILDTWRRGGDRTNSNWLIMGQPGTGKSATVKNVIIREYALGAKVIFLDPEREYVDLVRNLGGVTINCGGGIGGRINPLQVREAPRLTKEEGEEDEYFDPDAGASALALHFQTLRTFFKLYKRDITDLEIAKLEEILEGTYRRFGIEWETDITALKSIDYPIFSDLYADIEKEAEKEPESDVIKKLLAYFRSIAKGADSYIFNGHTDLQITNDITCLDVSSLLSGDEAIMRAQFHNINSFVWQKIVQDREERIIYVIDEGYLVANPENPEALIFIKNVSKRCRKYSGSLMFVTHSVVDLLDSAVKRHGQVLLDNACFKVLMGTDGKNLEEIKELFQLTDAEESLLLSKQRGRGLLFAGSVRLAARIEIPERFLTLMGTSGGK